LFRPLQAGFIWASERTGFRHLYLYDWQGTLIRVLTRGEWMVDDVVGVDEENGRIYFTATRDDPLSSHLYVVGFDGGEPRKLTEKDGMHAVVMDSRCTRYVDTYQAIDRAPTVTLHTIDEGSPLALFHDRDPHLAELALDPPELVTLPNRDGTMLYGALYRPPDRFGDGLFPTIVSVYGGPHAQMVVNGWGMTVAMRAQYLRSLGFLVFALDNRGSARRGLAFEGAIKHDMGHLEVQDQVDGVRWLVERGLSDPQRVGVIGWSYGGYMAAMCLCRAPETFKVAVAGAPVTHWDGYDTFYTERYMGMPQSNPEGYQESSVIRHVAGMTGKLLLVHGLIDENVHFRHTARLINGLIAAGKRYDLLLLPDSRHGPRKDQDRVYLEERIAEYFTQHL
jgi:dipeptidyl-peptidase-4